ncbi:MAG: phage tail protein [Caldilineaceae bacterium]
MRLQNIQAIPHPAGNRIDLSWESDDLTLSQTVGVVGCEGQYPASPFDGASYQLQTPLSATATDLQGEMVYYFTLFVREQAKALVSDADAVYQIALDQAFLPESLRQALSPAGTEIAADAQIIVKEPGHKWLIVERSRPRIHTIEQETQSLGVCSYRFDPANRVSAMATAPYQLGQQLYELLPAIYRRYDTQLPLDPPATMPAKAHAYGQLRRFLEVPGGQLDQIYSLARALLHLYDLDRVDGRLLPLLADWIGWRTDPRRDLQQQRNDLRAAPYIQETIGTLPVVAAMIKRLNHRWDCRIKEFANNVLRANEPARLTLWSMLRSGDHWSTPTAPLSLDFAYEGRPSATCDDEGQLWLFYHTHRQGHWEICYKVNDQRMTGEWTPSVVLQPSSRQQMNRHPTALFSKGTLHLFWDRYDMAQQRGSLVYYTRTTGGGLERTKTLFAEQGGSLIERKQPWVVAVAEKELWLFWLERTTAQWQLRYSRYDGNQWGRATTFPALTTAGFDGAQDLFVLNGPGNKLYLFWSRRVLASDGQKYWRIVYQVQQHDNSWDPPVELPAPPEADDREPAAIISGDTVELFWSSNRQGSWSIWHCTLADSQLASPIDGADAARTPLPLATEAGVTLFYRSSATIAYTNPTARVSTLDTRYAGCTTVDPRNRTQIAQRGRFEDVTTYTYDTSPARWPHDTPLYARDTIGIYFPDEVADDPQHQENLRQIEYFLTNFLPIQIRLVFPSKPPPPNVGFTMVTGRVLDGTNGNVPLSGATIELGADQTVSGTGGRFTLRAVPIAQGDLTITVRKEMDGKRLRAVKTMAAVGGDITNFGDVVINLVKFWDGGGGDNNWQNAANWNDDTLPQEGDDVYIPRSATVDLASGEATINSLYCDGELTLKGGTLVVADASSVHTLTLHNGMLAGSGAVTVRDAFTWTGGTLTGVGRTVVLGVLTIGSNRSGIRLTLDGHTLENQGQVFCARDAAVIVKNRARIINAADATWDFQNRSQFDWQKSQGDEEQPLFENQGTVVKSGGDPTAINCRFVNSGTVQIKMGVVTVSGDYTQTDAGQLCISIRGATEATTQCQLHVTAAMTLAGTLAIDRSSEYTPDLGVRLPIVQFKTRTDAFSQVDGDTIDDNRRFAVRYEEKVILLEVVKIA